MICTSGDVAHMCFHDFVLGTRRPRWDWPPAAAAAATAAASNAAAAPVCQGRRGRRRRQSGLGGVGSEGGLPFHTSTLQDSSNAIHTTPA